jgi:hypothetical protein
MAVVANRRKIRKRGACPRPVKKPAFVSALSRLGGRVLRMPRIVLSQRAKKIAGSMMAMPSSLSASPRRPGGASSTIRAAKTTVAIPTPYLSQQRDGQYERHRPNDYVEERGKAQEQKPDGEEQQVTKTVQDAGHPDLLEPRREHERGRHESCAQASSPRQWRPHRAGRQRAAVGNRRG